MFLRCWRRSCSSTTARHRRSRRESSSRARRGTRPRLPSSQHQNAVARVWRCTRVRPGRSVGCRGWRTRTRGLRSGATDTARAEQSRLRRVEALEGSAVLNLESLPLPDRVLRRLEHPGGVAGRVDGGLPGRDTEEAHYRVRHPREGQAGRLRGARRGRLATSPASARRRREEYDEGFAVAPNLVVIDGGRVSCRQRSRRCRRTTCRGSR